MKNRRSDPGAENPADLQHLNFIQTHDDGKEAIFRAQVGNMDVPDAPVFALTVTVTSPYGPLAAADLQAFLKKIRANFALTAPGPDESPHDGQNPESFNIDKDILFEPELVQGASEDTVDMTMAVETTLDNYSWPEEVLIVLTTYLLQLLAWLLRFSVPRVGSWYSVRKGKTHYYQANGTNLMGAVTTSKGEVTMWPPEYGQLIPEPHTGTYENALRICVQGDQSRSTYQIDGSFHPIPSPPYPQGP